MTKKKKPQKPRSHKKSAKAPQSRSKQVARKKQKQDKPPGKRFSNPFDKLVGKWALVLTIGLIVAMGFVAFKDFLLVERLYFFKDIGSDEINIKYPAWKQLEALRSENTISYWSFYRGMGQNYFTGIPINPLALIQKPFVHAFGSDYRVYGRFPRGFVFYILFAGIVAFLYFRSLRLNKFTAVVGALLVAFAGYTIVGSAWAHGNRFFQGIFLLFAFEQLYRHNRWVFFPFAVLFISGNAFYLYLFALFLLLYSIMRYVSDQGWNIKNYFPLAGKMVGLGIVGIGMNAVNVVSPFLRMINSPRVSGNVSTMGSGGDASIFQIDNFPEGLTVFFRLLSNDLLGNGSDFKGWYNYLEAPIFYCGLISILLLPQIFIYVKGRRRNVYAAFLGFWTLVVLFPQLRHAIQLFVGNYYKGVIDFIIPMTILFFSLHALHFLIKTGKLNLWLLFGTLLILLVVMYYPNLPKNELYPAANNPIDRDLRNIVALFLIGHAVLLTALRSDKHRHWLLWALLLLVATELTYLSSYSVVNRVTYTADEFRQSAGGYNDATIDAVKHIKKHDNTFFRIEKDYTSGTGQHASLNDAQAQGYFGTPSYSSFNQKHYILFLEETGIIQPGNETQTRWAPGFRGKPLLQSFASVKYRIHQTPHSFYESFLNFDSIAHIDGKLKDSENGVDILKNQNYLPLGFTYDSYITKEQFDALPAQGTFEPGPMVRQSDVEVVNSLFSKKDLVLFHAFVANPKKTDLYDGLSPFELTDTTLSDQLHIYLQQYRQGVEERRRDTLAISEWSNSQIEGTIELDKKKLLFFTIPFDPGWKMWVDGKQAELHRTNIGFMGAVLDKGKHTVKLRYRPPYFKTTLGISIAFLIVFALLLIAKNFFFGKKKMKPKATENTANNTEKKENSEN